MKFKIFGHFLRVIKNGRLKKENEKDCFKNSNKEVSIRDLPRENQSLSRASELSPPLCVSRTNLDTPAET